MILHDVNAVVSREDLEPVLSFLPRLEALIPERIWSKELRISVDADTLFPPAVAARDSQCLTVLGGRCP